MALGSQISPIVTEGLVEERESKVMAISTPEQALSSMVATDSPPTSEDDVNVVDNLLVTEPILQEVPISDAPEIEARVLKWRSLLQHWTRL